LNRLCGTRRKIFHSEPIQPVRNLARNRRRRVERQRQHSCGERALPPERAGHPSSDVDRAGTEQSEISEGILQQSIVALQLLGQLLLLGGRPLQIGRSLPPLPRPPDAF